MSEGLSLLLSKFLSINENWLGRYFFMLSKKQFEFRNILGTVEEELDVGDESPELRNSSLRIQQQECCSYLLSVFFANGIIFSLFASLDYRGL